MPHDINYLKDESYQLIGACFEVYNNLGFGLAEEIYQESVAIEFELRSIPFVEKSELQCFYKNNLLRKRFIPDFITFKSIITELKAVSHLTEEHYGQLLNYMRITKSPLGYLINFGKRGGLDYKRFILSEFLPDNFNKEN